MAGILIRRFETADETRAFEHGRFELISLAGMTLGRASYEPGWVWSEHVGKAAGEPFCEVEHIGIVLSGRAAVKTRDGSQAELTPGDLFHIGPGHDSWVVGDAPYVSLHLLGADDYAKH